MEPQRYQAPDIPGVEWRQEEIRYHGPSREYVYPGRLAVVGEFAYPHPHDCLRQDIDGEWIADGRVLICPACGLDCT